MARSPGRWIRSHDGQKTETNRLFIEPGGMLMVSRSISPLDTLPSSQQTASTCQLGSKTVVGSTMLHMARTKLPRSRMAASRAASCLSRRRSAAVRGAVCGVGSGMPEG